MKETGLQNHNGFFRKVTCFDAKMALTALRRTLCRTKAMGIRRSAPLSVAQDGKNAGVLDSSCAVAAGGFHAAGAGPRLRRHWV